jgi:S-formylglutathione hydrolase FrmB
MKWMMIAVVLMLLVPPGIAGAGGTVDIVTFYSEAMDEERVFQIYLPEGYGQDGANLRYPVVYFLHGVMGSHEDYPFFPELLDNLIADMGIRPVIVVKPNGNSGPWWGASYYANSVIAGNVEDFIVQDLVGYIDDHYRTIPSRHHRAISGHSMGGYGCMHLALRHPDVFGATAPMSGFHDWEIYMEVIRPVILEQNDGPPYDYWPPGGFYTAAMFTLASVFSYNPDNPPFYFDLPLDSDGEFVEEVMDRLMLHDCRYLATELQRDLAIYLDCGIQDDVDDFAAYPTNVSFDQTLDELGLPHETYFFDGDHDDFLEDRVTRIILWFDDIRDDEDDYMDDYASDDYLVHKVGSGLDDSLLPSKLTEEGTQVCFALAQSAQVEIVIYDIKGRLIRAVVDRTHAAGEYSTLWDGQDQFGRSVPAGVYFAQMRVNGDAVDAGKIVMVR